VLDFGLNRGARSPLLHFSGLLRSKKANPKIDLEDRLLNKTRMQSGNRRIASLKQKQWSEWPCLINQNKSYKDAIRQPPDCIFSRWFFAEVWDFRKVK